VIDTAEGLDEIAGAWEALASRDGSPMQRHGWTKAFIETFGEDYELNVLVVGSGSDISAIAPLAKRRGGLGKLELAGVAELAEPGDFVYRDADALDGLAAVLAGLRLPILLGRVMADSPTVDALRRAHRRTIFSRRDVAPCPWILLDEGWQDPEQKLNSNRRSDLRRAQRRAEKIGEVATDLLSPAKNELPPLLDEVFRIEAAGWKGREGTALAHDERRRRFFVRYAEGAADAGILRLAFLRIGGQAAAVQLAAECGGRFWLLKVGYDEGFKRASPGTLLMVETIRHAATDGLQAYEFLGRAESWTRVWTEDEHDCVAIRSYPPRPRGLTAFIADVARYARPGRA
jgi:CelD/BcsL family acetyltransferase involved in cellulose biosynthesis